MRHIVASCYNRPVVEMTTLDIGVFETFFPLRCKPLVNPKSHMICLGLIPNHFVLLSLKDGCPLPPSSTEWKIHKSEEAATWEDEFLDQHDRFRTLMDMELKRDWFHQRNQQIKTIQLCLMFDDTPVKPNTKFEDVMEYLDDLLFLDEM